MKLAIVGSRNYPNLDEVAEYLAQQEDLECVVSGGARGVDRTAESWARTVRVPVVSFRPKRSPKGGRFIIVRYLITKEQYVHETLPGSYPNFAAAAFVRNGFIVDFADQVTAFWFDKSRGTQDSIARARVDEKLREVIVARI